MNAISSVKGAWSRPTLRRVPASEALKAEILAQAEARRREAGVRPDRTVRRDRTGEWDDR